MQWMDHQQSGAAAALWFCGLLVVTAASSSCPTTKLTTPLPEQCQHLPRVCVDHSVFVLYENRHNPRHELFEGLPAVHLKNVSSSYYGFSDVWGMGFQHPGPMVRPATRGEEAKELAHPQFSRCTVPLVIYAHNVYQYGDFFINTVAPLYMMQLTHSLDRRLTLVVDTLGMRLESFHRFLLSPLSTFRVTTLSHLSSRLPRVSAETYNPDGQHIRCFRQLLVCQMRGSGSSAAAALARSAPIHQPLWSTAQAIFNYYKHRLPAIDPEFADKSKLKVLIAALPRSDKIRAIVNQEQVWSWCSKFKPPQGVQDWNGTACLLHEFGQNLLTDLLYVSQADVLLGLHGDSLYWAFFMTQHSSVVEIRPRGFAGPQANRHMKDVTAADGDSILWWGIDIVDPAHSAPGLLEMQQQGLPEYWARERHVFMRLMACQYIFERIALTRGNRDTYTRFKERKEHHITDTLEPANEAGLYSPAPAPAAAQPITAMTRPAATGPQQTAAQAAQAARPPPPPMHTTAAGDSQSEAAGTAAEGLGHRPGAVGEAADSSAATKVAAAGRKLWWQLR